MRAGKRFLAIVMTVAFGLSVLFAIGCFVSMVDGTYQGTYAEYRYIDDDDAFGYLLSLTKQTTNNVYFLAGTVYFVFGLLFVIAAVVFLAISVKSFLELRDMPKKIDSSKHSRNSYASYVENYVNEEEYERNKRMF